MANIQILVNNGDGRGFQAVDLPTDNSVKLTLYKSVQDFRDPLKATGAVSLPFTLPLTHKNSRIFNYDDDKQKLGKFKGVYLAQLVVDNEILVNGELNLSKIKATRKGFEVYIGQTQLLAPRLGDLLKGDKLTDLQSFERLAFSGNTSVLASWNANLNYPDTEICFPHVVRSFADLVPTNDEFNNSQFQGWRNVAYHTSYEDLGVSHYCAAIVRAIFGDAGYAVQGDIFQNDTFQRLIMLYSNSGEQKWNYGTLAPMRSTCDLLIPGGGNGFPAHYDGQVPQVYKRQAQNDQVQVLTYNWKARTGDLSESLGTDGVYTCKYGGLYTITIQASELYTDAPGFTVLRSISDNEFLDEKDLPSNFSILPTPAQLDIDTVLVGPGTQFTREVRLQAGKQYQVQRYVQFTTDPGSFIVFPDKAGHFDIDLCAGPLLLNPALFLPDMTQKQFLEGIFKLLNLYYQVDIASKTVTLYARDDFFQTTLDNLLDVSRFLCVEDMDETPFTDAEIASARITWATDDNDAILKGTDYMEKVNGPALTGTTVLPFAPLGYMKTTYQYIEAPNFNFPFGYDCVPAIIPYTDGLDTTVLRDIEAATQPGSWTPRLALNQGNDWLKRSNQYFGDSSKTIVAMGHPIYDPPSTSSGFSTYHYPLEGYSPKLSFFNINNQPSYEVDENTGTQSFTLSGYSGTTIYNPPSSMYLRDVNQVQQMDYVSLAPNTDSAINPQGFYLQLYGNDLLTYDYSNYLQGVGRMNSVLWNQLTGRQVLRIANDLYLLDSLTNFDVNAKLVTYRLLKLVGNTALTGLPTSGGTSGGTLVYTSTMTATASCPANTSGATRTATATRTSYVSQPDADQKAYQAALSIATGQLVCTVTGYVGYGFASATCTGNTYGYDVTGATATYVSTIDQQDADTQAQVAAQQNANMQLVCYLSPLGQTPPNGTVAVKNIMGDLTLTPSFGDAQMVAFSKLKNVLYAPNAKIKRGQPLYIYQNSAYHNLADGYYPFCYVTRQLAQNGPVQAVQMQNGLVVDYIDTVNQGATA